MSCSLQHLKRREAPSGVDLTKHSEKREDYGKMEASPAQCIDIFDEEEEEEEEEVSF
jgi:hypothetical protein